MTVWQVHGKHAFAVGLKQGPRSQVPANRHHIAFRSVRVGQIESTGERLDGLNHLVLAPNSVRADRPVLS